MSSLGNRIKQVRQEKKARVEDLAAATGLPRSTIFKYEKLPIDKVPLAAIRKLADALEVSALYLSEMEDDLEEEYLDEAVDLPEGYIDYFSGDVEAAVIAHRQAQEDAQREFGSGGGVALSRDEQRLIEKYRSLDDSGKSFVEAVTEREYQRVTASHTSSSVSTLAAHGEGATLSEQEESVAKLLAAHPEFGD